MVEAVHMSLSPFDWATLLAASVIVWWLIQRADKKREAAVQQAEQIRETAAASRQGAMDQTLGRLSNVVEDLSAALYQVKGWVTEHHVTKPDHQREMENLEKALRRDLEQHVINCPGRKGRTPE
jgi:hypothetical protein